MTLPKPFYQDDYATIYHGDCREILPLLPKVDLVLTDPQYGIGRCAGMGGGGFDSTGRYRRTPKTYAGGWDKEPPTDGEIRAVIGAGRSAIIWGANYFGLKGGKWLVWNKEQVMPSYSDAELAWTNLPGDSVKMFTFGCNRARVEQGLHPTQKPVALMIWCLGFGSFKLVCDPYLGSGTSLVAAKMKGIQAIGIEREQSYCEIAANRLRNESNPLIVEQQSTHSQQNLI